MLYRKLLAKKLTHVIVFVQCIFILLEVFSFFGLSGLHNNYQNVISENSAMAAIVNESNAIAQDLQEIDINKTNWNTTSKKLLSNLNEYRLYSVKASNESLNKEINTLISQFNEVDSDINTSGNSELTGLLGENINSISSYINTSLEKDKSKSANLLFIVGGFIIIAALLVTFAHLYCLFSLFTRTPTRSYNYTYIDPQDYSSTEKPLYFEEVVLSSNINDENIPEEPEIDYSEHQEKVNVA